MPIIPKGDLAKKIIFFNLVSYSSQGIEFPSKLSGFNKICLFRLVEEQLLLDAERHESQGTTNVHEISVSVIR